MTSEGNSALLPANVDRRPPLLLPLHVFLFVLCNKSLNNVFFFCLQGKLQKHQAFEAEISAHSNAIVELQENGEGMINESHYASDLIRVKYFVYTVDLVFILEVN